MNVQKAIHAAVRAYIINCAMENDEIMHYFEENKIKIVTTGVLSHLGEAWICIIAAFSIDLGYIKTLTNDQ